MDKKNSREYQRQQKEIRERLNGRAYSLGLDLGVGSIGLAAIALERGSDDKNYATDVVFAVSRVFKSSEGASDRRLKRGQRNSIRHKANRLKKLWKLLAEKGLMLPYSEIDTENTAKLRFSDEAIKIDPYKVRYKGLREKLTREELGVALYHIANHRGSSSISSGENLTDDEKLLAEKQKLTEDLKEKLGLSTFIEIIMNYTSQGGKTYRNVGGDPEQPVPVRDIIENEVDRLLIKQKEYYPELLSDDYISLIKETIFYENEMIVPEAGKCPYFPNESKLPKASFINEERRIWEELNNTTYDRDYEENGVIKHSYKNKLSQEEKNKLFKKLREGKPLKKKDIEKELRLQGEITICLPGKKEKSEIKGFSFKKLENNKIFSSLDESKQNTLIGMYVNSVKDENFKKRVKEEYNFTDEEINELVNCIKTVPKGYAPVGESAMYILLPLIMDEGLSFAEAENVALDEGLLELNYDDNKVFERLPYYGEVLPAKTQEVMGKAWHSAYSDCIGKAGFGKPNTDINEERFGRIANPVVHQTLNELRKLINEIIDILGLKPEEITLELGKELKVGKEEREKMIKTQNANEKENQRLFKEYCEPNGLSRKDIKKFKLYEEQAMICPYCLGKIRVEEIVNNNVDIDHIFPKEDYPDSSLNNLVLGHKTCNENIKVKRIPYEAFHGNRSIWNKIEQYLDNTEGMKSKKWRFETTEEEYQEILEKNGFLKRFTADNAYIARVAVQYLQCLFEKEQRLSKVKAIKGRETAILRKAWNINGITDNLGQLRNDDEIEGDKKNRNDVRHHALDAITIGYYTNSIKHFINNARNLGINEYQLIQRIPIPKYCLYSPQLSKEQERKEFRKTIENFITNECFVSRKVVVDKNGQFLKDTIYSIIASKDNNLILATRKSLDGLKIKTIRAGKEKDKDSLEYKLCNSYEIPKWVSKEERKGIEKLVDINRQLFNKILQNTEAAFEELQRDNQEKEASGKKTKTITEKSVMDVAVKNARLKSYWEISNHLKNKMFVQKE